MKDLTDSDKDLIRIHFFEGNKTVLDGWFNQARSKPEQQTILKLVYMAINHSREAVSTEYNKHFRLDFTTDQFDYCLISLNNINKTVTAPSDQWPGFYRRIGYTNTAVVFAEYAKELISQWLTNSFAKKSLLPGAIASVPQPSAYHGIEVSEKPSLSVTQWTDHWGGRAANGGKPITPPRPSAHRPIPPFVRGIV